MPSISEILNGLEAENRLRTIPAGFPQDVVDLSSNDYLGLAGRHAAFMPEFLDRFGDAPFTSAASRLLSGRQHRHLEYEDYLESLYGKPALLFNSGYHANVGAIGALALPGTLFVCDKLVHASIIDGLSAANAEYKRFAHNDIVKLERILEKESHNYERVVVVTESIFSMDGDTAPLTELVTLKKKYGCMLYVDEAHAFGVRGARGLGLAEELGIISDIDILVGTLGKAAASAGAFTVASDQLKSLLLNRARPFIFSTALPPVNVAWSHLMTEKITAMTSERRHLAEMSKRFKQSLQEATGQTTAGDSQIIPLLTGDAAKALSTASRLREGGFIALPIRRPTVPPGGERIRFSLSADLDFDRLAPVFPIISECL